MANFNKVILAGNLTRDPEIKHTQKSVACNAGIAINRKWYGQDGQAHEEVAFVDMTAFGKEAERFAEYARKGSNVLVEGRLKFEQWEAKDGTKRTALRVVIERFQMLGRREQHQDQDQDQERSQRDYAPVRDADIPF